MKIKIAACLLSLALLPACSTTRVAEHQSLEQRLTNKYAAVDMTSAEPAPPAEGPDDVPAGSPPAEGPTGIMRNPNLVPSPLLRQSAASSTP